MYSQLFELQAELFGALAHPRRLEIINLLRDQELPVTDIHSMLDLPQANISQHLMVLREAGVVQSRRDGKQIFYCLCQADIAVAVDLLRNVLVSQHPVLSQADELQHSWRELLPLVHDPVCQMRISPRTAGFSHRYHDHTYYFCASGCQRKFINQPEVYVNASSLP